MKDEINRNLQIVWVLKIWLLDKRKRFLMFLEVYKINFSRGRVIPTITMGYECKWNKEKEVVRLIHIQNILTTNKSKYICKWFKK